MINERYKIVNGTCYLEAAPDSLVRALELARADRTRVSVTHLSGRVESGYVGRTTGFTKCPILVHNSRSLGGQLLDEDTIVEVVTSRGKELLWKRA